MNLSVKLPLCSDKRYHLSKRWHLSAWHASKDIKHLRAPEPLCKVYDAMLEVKEVVECFGGNRSGVAPAEIPIILILECPFK